MAAAQAAQFVAHLDAERPLKDIWIRFALDAGSGHDAVSATTSCSGDGNLPTTDALGEFLALVTSMLALTSVVRTASAPLTRYPTRFSLIARLLSTSALPLLNTSRRFFAG